MSNIITVNFRNDTLFAVERDDGVFVAVKPICDSLGIEWRKQRERIMRDPILSEGSTMVVLPSIGGAQETTLLKLEMVNGWLFGIDESRVKDEETRQRVLSYKRECYSVLFKHFYGRNLNDKQPEEASAGTDSNEPMVVRKGLVTEARHTFNIQSARELWCKLNLPTTPSMFLDPVQGDFFHYSSIQKAAPLEKEAA